MPDAPWPAFAFATEFLVRLSLISFILVRRPRHTESNLAWIVVILAVPLLGILGYLLLGEVRLGRRRIRRWTEFSEQLAPPPLPEDIREFALSPDIPQQYAPIATLAEAVGGNRAYGGNMLQLIGNTEEFVCSLIRDIDAAIEHCHLLYYIYLDDSSGRRVADALIRAEERGVQCRLLVDEVGSRPFCDSALRARMEGAGVQVVAALHANLLRMLFARLDLRNHRKLAVIDGTIGYVGSHNIADAEFAPKPRYAPWVDAGVRIRGPAVRELQLLFIEDWYLDMNESLVDVLSVAPLAFPEGIAVQVMGTGPSSYNEALRQIIATAFHTAREELILTTPYFVPDNGTMIALETAARRGIETMLIVPARNDSPLVAAASRSYYEPLLDAGVRIFEYRSGLLHAKTLTLDRNLGLITTANLDRRSFELNFEVSVVVYDDDFASQLRFLQTSYLSDSDEITLAGWCRRSLPRKLLQNAAGLLSPLL